MYYAKDYRAMARNSLKGHWPLSVLVVFIGMLLGGLDSSSILEFNLNEGDFYLTIFGQEVGRSNGIDSALGVAGNVFSDFAVGGSGFIFGAIGATVGLYALLVFLIGGAIELGIRNYFLKLNYDMNPEIGDMFVYIKKFGKALGLRIVMGVFIFLWSLLLIIPGIVAAYRYSMATYIMAENPDIGIMEAIEASKAMMVDRKWKLFCLDISFIGWIILCGFTFGLGYLLLHPYMESARAHFYLTLKHGMVQ